MSSYWQLQSSCGTNEFLKHPAVHGGPRCGGREGKGREGKGREGKGREGKGREGKGREGRLTPPTMSNLFPNHCLGIQQHSTPEIGGPFPGGSASQEHNWRGTALQPQLFQFGVVLSFPVNVGENRLQSQLISHGWGQRL